MAETLDIVIVGGGINGAGIARDAAGRGLSVLLCEKNDLASATSSASTKLIHGGLRYLEYYEFRLVRKALIEREVLLRSAPHIIWPLRFVLPHNKGLRPAWMIRLGLFLYDHLGGRKLLPASEGIDLRRHPAGAPLDAGLRKAFVYSDCWVQDSRLVVLNAMDARERGAEVLTRVECVSARREDDHWRIVLRDRRNGAEREVTARALVNAAGPWTAEFIERRAGLNKAKSLRLVKGSHIVVPKLFEHEFPYIFQNPDGRIVFAIPYEDGFTLIGTTDVDFDGDPGQVSISEEEVAYLCDAVNAYFNRKVGPSDVVWTYSGVRPLYDDDAASASSATRDYVLEVDHSAGRAPLLSVFGGKITTFRRLAEHAMAKLEDAMGPLGAAWTAQASLPGGDIPDADFEGFANRFCQAHAWLPARLARRYLRSYGTRTEQLLAGAGSLEDLGESLGDGLYAVELHYLMRNEWVQTAEDLLWRRSKLGLHITDSTKRNLDAWLARQDSRAARQESA
ncbi:MAG: glycerol-3-phosphate dehydrogenase [Kiloniellaceae bacterium]